MKKWLLCTLVVLSLGVTQARTYVGIGATFVDFILPLPSIQVGGLVAQNVEMRGTLDTTLSFNNLGADLLYVFAISGAPLEPYLGGGLDAVWIFFGGGEPFLAAHATAGLEYFAGDLGVSGIDSVGVYAELQPLVPLLGTVGMTSFVKARAGVNFYF